jgi:ATP/maltotriose-dependent transcriptional regulator MalT
LLGLAELAREDGDFNEAWELAHDSLGVLDDYGDRVGAAAALEQVADLAVARGEPERALRLLAASQRFHEETGIARFPFQADHGERLFTSVHTVKKHLSHFYAKVGLDSRAELVAQAAHRDL